MAPEEQGDQLVAGYILAACLVDTAEVELLCRCLSQHVGVTLPVHLLHCTQLL
jgi:hypothetical protein